MSTELFSAEQSVVACELEGGAALLDLRTSTYFSLNAVGAVLWQALQAPSSLDRLCKTVAETFDVTEQACRADVAGYVDQLSSRNLVLRTHG